MEIEWTKIIAKPEAKYKVEGNILLKYRMMTENLNKELDAARKKAAELDDQNKQLKATIDSLQSKLNESKASIENLEGEIKKLTESASQKEAGYQKKIDAIQNEADQLNSEIEHFSKELTTLNEKLAETQNKLQESESKVLDAAAKITDLEREKEGLIEENETLKTNIIKIDEVKDELQTAQQELKEKLSEISILNEKISDEEKLREQIKEDMQNEIEALKVKHHEELNAKIEEYETKMQELKDSYGVSPQDVEFTGKEQVIMLRYTGTDFLFVRKKPDEGIILILDQLNSKWLFVWDQNASFIDRRTAERIARSIAKAGWPLPGGGRVGMGFDLELQGDKAVPERLLRDQHKYME